MPRLIGAIDIRGSTPQAQPHITSYRAGIESQASAEALRSIGGAGQDIQQAGLRGISVGRQREEADDQTSYATAGSNFTKTLLETKDKLAEDPDYSTYSARWQEAAAKARDEQAALIKNPKLAEKFKAAADLDIAQGWSDLAKVGHGKEADVRVANLNDLMAQNLETSVKLRDPMQRTRLVDDTGKAIIAAADGGWISHSEAGRLQRQFAQDYAVQSIAVLPPGEQLAALVPGGAKTAAASPVAAPSPDSLPPAVSAAIDRGAKNDTDAGILKTFAVLESSGDAGAKNPNSPAAGLMQIMPATAKQYGVTDPYDVGQSVKGAQGLLTDNRKALRASLGREPTTGELYLAHQQGATGAAALLANPDKPAVTVLTSVYRDEGKAQAAIAKNGGTADMTAGQFASMWTAKAGDTGAAQPLETPPGGYDFSQKTGTAVDLIPVADRMKMIASAQAKVKQDQQEQRQALQAQVALGYEDQKRNAFLSGKVDPAFAAQVIAADPNATGAARIEDLNHEADVGSAFNLIKGQTTAEDTAMKARAKAAAEVPGPGSAEAADYYKRIGDAIDAKQKDLDTDLSGILKDSQDEANAAINANKDDWMQTAAATGEVVPEAKTAIAESSIADKSGALSVLEQAAELGKIRQQVEDQNLTADKSTMERLGLMANASGPGSAILSAQAKTLSEAIEKKQKAIQDDPGGYFAATNDGVKSAWAAVDANPQDTDVAQTAAAMSVAAQIAYGVPADQVRPFSNDRAAQFAQTIMTGQPDQAMSSIDQVRTVAGDEGLKQVLGQKGVPAMAKFLAFADGPMQEPIRAAALEAMKVPPENLAKQVKARGYGQDDIDSAVSGVIGPLLNTMPSGGVDPYQESLDLLTKYYVSQGKTPGQGASLAWSVFDQTYAFHRTFRVPRTFDDQKVQDGMNGALQNLGQFAIVPQSGGPAGAAPGYALDQTIKQLQTGGLRWVTNANDTGVIATYDVGQNGLPGPAVKTTTGRLELSFADLEAGKYGSKQPGAHGRIGIPSGSQ
jgi:hypothetical protein